MMNTARVNTVAGAIAAAQDQGRKTPAGIAMALEDRCLLQSPESAAETARLRAENAALIVRLGVLEAERHSTNKVLSQALEQAHRDRDLLAEYARQRLREGVAAEARHEMDPAEGQREAAFYRMTCACCNNDAEATS